MPQFTWTGRDAQQQLRSGMIDAASALHAAEVLASMSLVPVAILPFPPPSAVRAEAVAARRQPPVTTEDRLEFARQMHTLLRAGIRVPRALTGLGASTAHRGLAQRLEQIGRALDDGWPLSQALAQHGAVFDPFWVALVQHGETHDTLAESFKAAYLHEEFRSVMARQLAQAARYPALLAACVLGVGTVGLGLVVPAAMPALAGLNLPLPAVTQAVLAGSRAFSDAAPALWLGAFGLATVGRLLQRGAAGRRFVDRLRLLEPLAGPVRRHNTQSRVAGALALGLRSGMPADQSLALASRQAGHAIYEARAWAAHARVRAGEDFVDALAATQLLPTDAVRLLGDGTSPDTLQDALVEIAQDERAAADVAFQTLQRRFQGLLMVGLGAWVLMLAVALLAPLAGLEPAALLQQLRG